MVVYTDDLTLQTYITTKIVERCIEKLPKFLWNILMKFRVRIYITDVFEMTGIHGLGCYYLDKTQNGVEEIAILIEKKTCNKAKSIFYHEIGHFLDDLLGCYKANVPFTKENRATYRFSKNDECFHYSNFSENDFFTQIKRNTNDEMFFEDMRESFAECFAEIMMNKRCLKMKATKNVIFYELKENFSEFENEESCKKLCYMLQYS